MQYNINFGIDLGTTNSAIGVYIEGKVVLLKNPKGFRELLPSAVGFKNGRIFTGEKALELLKTNPQLVISSFKRNMGTDKIYKIEAENIEVNPVALSAQILSTLLAFERDKTIQSCVITIPASFDTVQSNATKKAGEMAGLKEVLLLQEPIAACLAYANENNIDLTEKQYWVVYDFGGGTFDCALIAINNRELKTINHLGNNFLGGFDIDQAILNKVVLPQIDKQLFERLNQEELSTLHSYLIAKIEDAKKELSVANQALIEIEYDELDLFKEIPISINEFNDLVKPFFNESMLLLAEMLEQCGLQYHNLNRIILVGGTTYIPFIRENLKLQTGLTIDSSIDPTTAVVKGAAYYAGSKLVQIATNNDKFENKINANLLYENNSRDDEELIDIKTKTNFNGFIQIERLNDHLLLPLEAFNNHMQVFVPLLPNTLNMFHISLLNGAKKIAGSFEVAINQGNFSINGQPLPADICLELDNEGGETLLEPIFLKNTVLPLKKTVYKTLSKTVLAGSNDHVFINVLEGKRGTLPASNLSIGIINIEGSALKHDLVKGTPIELNISISESRDLEVVVNVPSADLKLKSVFNPHTKLVNKHKVQIEIQLAIEQITPKITAAIQEQNFELVQKYQNCSDGLTELLALLNQVNDDNLYKLDEQKRTLLKALDSLDRAVKLQAVIEEWHLAKQGVLLIINELNGNQKAEVEAIIQSENDMLNSGDRHWIAGKTKILSDIESTNFYSNAQNYGKIFLNLKSMPITNYTKTDNLASIMSDGEKALMANNYVLVKDICHILISQLNKDLLKQDNLQFKTITGIK